MFTLMCCLGFAGLTNAQFDDIYFNPSDADEVYAQIDLDKYSDESYESKSVKPDDYDYYYASRIQRFDRPYYGFDFYSPVYVDPYYYNRAYSNFYRPGTSIYWGGPVPASTSAYGLESYGSTASVYGGTTVTTGFGGYSSGYGGFGTAGSYNGYGASYGGGGFGGSSYGGGGYNAYCPPSVGGIYGNPATGVFQPGTTSAPNPNSRSGSAVAGNTVYGPRGGGSGSVTTSPRNNTTGTGAPAPDRPYAGTSAAGAATGSPRAGQKTYAGETGSSSRSSYGSPRTTRPAYTAPSNRPSAFTKTTSAKNRFSTTRPARPSANSYSPTRSYSGSNSATRSTYSRPSSSSGTRSSSVRSSSSSSRSFSSPRSSGGSSRSGGSPRGGQ